MGIKLDIGLLCVFIVCLFADIHSVANSEPITFLLWNIPWPIAIGWDLAGILYFMGRIGIWWKEQTPEQKEVPEPLEIDDK
jgi:hypothetical protein